MPPGQLLSLASIPYAAETTAFYDGKLILQGPAMIVLTDLRHHDGANVSFLDGHARWHSRGDPPRGCQPDYYHVVPGP